MDTVDILILNRNYSKFLNDAIDSCLSQTYNKINIIIVDDNSTDTSKIIIEDYASKYKNIKFELLLDECPGISKVRNKLIQLSTSKYLSFLSSDDYYAKTFIEESLSILKDTPSDIGGVYSGFRWVDEDKKFKSSIKAYDMSKEKLRKKIKEENQCMVYFESSLFKREIFNCGVTFREEIKVGEENAFIREIIDKYNFIANRRSFLAYKREHQNSGHIIYKDIWQQELEKIKNIP